MNPAPDENEASAADQVVSAVLRQPLSPDVESRLRLTLAAICERLDGPTVSLSSDQSSWTSWKKVVAVVSVAAIVLVCSWKLQTTKMAARRDIPVVPRVQPVVPGVEVVQPDIPQQSIPAPANTPENLQRIPDEPVSVADMEPDEDGYGALTGQVVIAGTIPSSRPHLVKDLKDLQKFSHCGSTVPDESVVIDSVSRGVANVFVYVVRPTSIHPSLESSKPVTVDASCGRFIPHAMVVRTNQAINVRSLDPFAYNTHTHSIKNAELNFIQGAKPTTVSLSVAERLPFKVVDDIHPWMEAYWLVLAHPYATVTDKQGRFTIRKLPAGPCELHIWHERIGYVQKNMKVTIESSGKTDLGSVSVTADQFRS
jgi:hypothetical protein